MADYVTIRMETPTNLAAAKALLPSSDAYSRAGTIEKIRLSDLGLRSLRGGDYTRHTETGQEITLYPWDGVAAVTDAVDILTGAVSVPQPSRVRFLLTDTLQKSIEYGVIKEHVDRGFLVIEGYTSDSAVDAAGVTYAPGTPANWPVVPADVAAALDTLQSYTPAAPGDWAFNPTTIWEAIDRIAAEVAILKGGPIA